VESIFNTVKNQSEVKVGSLRNARRFIHISDIANGIKKSIGLTGFNILNLSGDRLITMKDLIEESQKILNKTVNITEINPSQISIRNPSNNKAKKVLSWKPEIGLESGLKSILPFI
jgi:nucleoside-diphosphate-sugar epimerase